VFFHRFLTALVGMAAIVALSAAARQEPGRSEDRFLALSPRVAQAQSADASATVDPRVFVSWEPIPSMGNLTFLRMDDGTILVRSGRGWRGGWLDRPVDLSTVTTVGFLLKSADPSMAGRVVVEAKLNSSYGFRETVTIASGGDWHAFEFLAENSKPARVLNFVALADPSPGLDVVVGGFYVLPKLTAP
jgi:hypothetical protein